MHTAHCRNCVVVPIPSKDNKTALSLQRRPMQVVGVTQIHLGFRDLKPYYECVAYFYMRYDDRHIHVIYFLLVTNKAAFLNLFGGSGLACTTQQLKAFSLYSLRCYQWRFHGRLAPACAITQYFRFRSLSDPPS